MTEPKRSLKTEVIKIRCSPATKQLIQRKAQRAGSATLSDYVLSILLEDNTQEYGYEHRKPEGPLVNAALYKRLGDLIAVLQERPDSQEPIQDVIELVHEARRDIAIRRLQRCFEEISGD